MSKFHGTFYEIAYHDYTQPVGVCGCMRSVKSFDTEKQKVMDDFTLNCGSNTGNQHTHTYHNALSFDVSPVKGEWNGHWPLTPGVVFPDTLVDVGPVVTFDGKEQYAWVLELQCVEIFGHVAFYGSNFYSSLKEHTYLEEMKTSWHNAGLDYVLYPAHDSRQLTLVDHTGCLYNNTAMIQDPKFENLRKNAFHIGAEKEQSVLDFL